mgnify:CR=1 FL=1
MSDSTSRVRYSSGYTCQYERGRQPKGSGKQLLSNYNPHRSWLGLTEQQKFTFGEASVVRSEGVLSFCNGCEGSNIQCNGRQSLRLDGRRVCSIKRVGISQAESNKIKACVLPSIHLPLTREASVVVRGEGVLFFCNGCGNGVGRCNGRGKQGKDALACVP